MHTMRILWYIGGRPEERHPPPFVLMCSTKNSNASHAINSKQWKQPENFVYSVNQLISWSTSSDNNKATERQHVEAEWQTMCRWAQSITIYREPEDSCDSTRGLPWQVKNVLRIKIPCRIGGWEKSSMWRLQKQKPTTHEIRQRENWTETKRKIPIMFN